MSRLRDIKDYINGAAPNYANISTKIMGLPIYIDPILTGDSRFSRKSGAIGLINPDNQIFLNSAANINQTQIEVNRANKWFTEGCVISLNFVEKFKVLSIEDKVFNLDTAVKVNQLAESPVNLYAVPIIAINNYSIGTSVIQLRSKHKMLIGDVVAVELYKNIFSELEIIDLVELLVSNNDFPYTYEVTLKNSLPRALSVDEVFYLRAYPAYFSKILRLPNNPLSNKPIGPFVVDYFGGKIINGQSPETFLSLQKYDLFGNKIDSTSPVNISQNHVVSEKSISSSTIMFWDLMSGTFKLNNNNALGLCDEDGNFGVSYKCKPSFTKGNTWKLSINCSTDSLLRVGFEPNNFVTYNLTSGHNTILVGDKNLLDYERITIVAKSSPGALLEFTEWELQEAEVNRLSYGIMAKVENEASWLASGLIVKPLFLTVDYLTANYDNDSNYDAGLIYT